MNLANIALARTFLFNFGRGDVSPFSVFRDICRLYRIQVKLNPIPNYRYLVFPFSFFSKNRYEGRYHFPILYNPDIEGRFLLLEPAIKLNWARNFHWMQELLFNFTSENLGEVENILLTLKRPVYDYSRLPFEIEKRNSSLQIDSTSILQFSI